MWDFQMNGNCNNTFEQKNSAKSSFDWDSSLTKSINFRSHAVVLYFTNDIEIRMHAFVTYAVCTDQYLEWLAQYRQKPIKVLFIWLKKRFESMHGKTENVILICKTSKLLRFPSCSRVLWQSVRVCHFIPLLWAFKSHCDDTFCHWVYSIFKISHIYVCIWSGAIHNVCEVKRNAGNLDCGQFGMQYRFLFCTSFAFVTIAISFAF